MKPIVAFDFDGTSIHAKAGKEAHHEWFRVMSMLMEKPTVKKLAGREDYFKDVFRVMEAYTGLTKSNRHDQEKMTKLARNLYQLCFLGKANQHKKHLLVKPLKDLIVKLKKKSSVALITTTPEDIVTPILRLVGCERLFNVVSTQPLNQEPSKTALLTQFTNRYGKPICYVGNSEEDVKACKRLRIPSIFAKWDQYEKAAEKKADHVVKTVAQLDQLLHRELLK